MANADPREQLQPHTELTNTGELRGGELLEVVRDDLIVARLEVLDSHNPRLEDQSFGFAAKARRPLEEHHHLLVQIEGDDQVIPAGLFVGRGGMDLFFSHATLRQGRDGELVEKMIGTKRTLTMGGEVLRVAAQGRLLSTLPEAQKFLDENGELKR